MAFLPFFISKHSKLKVIIVGGGYAGIAAMTTILRYAPDTEVILIDPGSHHLKITHLHETFRYPLTDLLVPFSELESRYGCRHISAKVILDQALLQQYQITKQIRVGEEVIDFDYLLVATGCENRSERHDQTGVLSLSDFTVSSGSELLTSLLSFQSDADQYINVIGGGATGIQFLFEIKQFLARIRSKASLRLIHSGSRVLQQFPVAWSRYVEARMHEMDIVFCPDTYYCGQQTDTVLLKAKHTSEHFELPSRMSILFLGKKQEYLFTANAFGQIMTGDGTLDNIFVAGDCSQYQSLGSNSQTAQSAVRKGKLSARNILRHSGLLGLLEPYLHQELGYVVSMGAADAVGWLGSEMNVMTGVPAVAIKELVEAQFDLLLSGMDTYLV